MLRIHRDDALGDGDGGKQVAAHACDKHTSADFRMHATGRVVHSVLVVPTAATALLQSIKLA